MDPYWLSQVRDRNGATIEQARPKGIPVLDRRIAFLMTDIMQGVINRGTGAGVRARGFTAPAAGKTGTSHDGWFAGYTSNLLTVVWVGYDSNEELRLSGAASALPIWTEFMKRAVTFYPYRQTQAPVPPPGVVQATIDSDTGELATPHCPRTETAYFVAGTQPGEYCHLHYLQPGLRSPSVPAIAGVVSPPVQGPAAAPAVLSPTPGVVTPAAQVSAPAPPAPPVAAAPPPEPPQPRRRGFFGRIVGIFTGGSDNPESGKQ